jgi:hypothetical protein
MSIKRNLLSIAGVLFCAFLIFSWVKYNEGGPVPYPINIGVFFSIGSATIDPTTLLEDIRSGEQTLFLHPQSNFPENPPFIVLIGWSQNDYIEIAKALYKEIWNDDPSKWHLYRVSFYTSCKNSSGKFESAELYYYQEVKVDGKRMYSVRDILVQPEYGYIVWGGDTKFPRPLWGWAEIDLEDIKRISAEEALKLADQQEGSEFRNKNNNDCRISVDMWPWGYERSDWKVGYSGQTYNEIWIPSR